MVEVSGKGSAPLPQPAAPARAPLLALRAAEGGHFLDAASDSRRLAATLSDLYSLCASWHALQLTAFFSCLTPSALPAATALAALTIGSVFCFQAFSSPLGGLFLDSASYSSTSFS